ncbi:MAG: hypothetical protein Q8L60_12115 [Gammaproteobacteria bacterium]|nr:hypothetical protein [Gammaproteobacteria bacterium]MDP2141632.1 hypothetical protein [Gammaproteobacteria bacterium]MDP2346353.1 hypothetical protein [Gammaproteobacteria bacterium]
MKATLTVSLLAIAALGLALVQYNTVQELQRQLSESENHSVYLQQQIQEQTETNTRLQSTFEEQINQLQQNLQSSSRQLVILSESLQETRELLNQNAPAVTPVPGTAP